MPDTFAIPPAVAAAGGRISFDIHEPKQRMEVTIEDKPVYLDDNGRPTTEYVSGMRRARRPVNDAEGRALYYEEGTSGTRSVNPYTENADGTVTKREPVTETYTQQVRVETPVFEADGTTPKVEFATMSGTMQAVNAERQRHPKAISLDYDDITDAERDTLASVFKAAWERKCAELGIHPTVAQAEAAGAFTG